jgi:signal transduction histidine kinase
MSVSRKVPWLVFVTVLLMAALVLLLMLRAPDTRLADAQASITDMKQTDALWNANVLSLEQGLNPNYDSVATPVVRLMQHYSTIARLAKNGEAEALQSTLTAYKTALDDKIGIVERIKAQYSIISNSSRLLPIAAADLFTQLEGEAIDAQGPQIADLLTRIVINVASYIVTPGEQVREDIDQQMAALRQAASRTSPDAASKMETLLVHVDIILRQRQLGTQLIVAFMAAPTAPAIDRLQSALQDLENDQSRQWTLLRDLQVLCIILIVAAAAWAAHRLRRRYKRLNQDNSALQLANEDAQSQLIQSSKLSAMGQMVAGITHEINTPLAYVKAVFSLIKDQMAEINAAAGGAAPGGDARPATRDGEREERISELNMLIDEGVHGLDEISKLIITMKNFSRLDKGRLDYVDVEEALDSAILIARSEIKYIAETVKDYGNIPKIHASATQLKQVFLNLINNAAHAMADQPQRGKLTLRTRQESGDTIRIEIEDSGCGIPADVLPRIFDPFFTTKDVGKGTGMGLSICYRIIHTHGGTISARSRAGAGTIFTIILPHRGKADGEQAFRARTDGEYQLEHATSSGPLGLVRDNP